MGFVARLRMPPPSPVLLFPRMASLLRTSGWLALAAACCLTLLPGPAHAAETPGSLQWNRAERRVDADLEGWPLSQVLERVAAATGWEVFVEPDLQARIGARFSGKREREALAILLADLNFALIPQSNAPARLLVFRSSTSGATLAIRPPAPPSAVVPQGTNSLSNELIVRLKKGSRTDIHALARRLGGRVVGSLDSLGAHRLAFDDAAAAANAREGLAEEPDVASVESNYPIRPPSHIEAAPGMAIPAAGLRARPWSDASSVVVALLDTGIPTAGVAHADFLLPGVSVNGSAAPAGGELTHGSAMFETIVQGLSVTQDAGGGQPIRVLPVDIYGGQSQASTFELAQGIVAALERGADILNLSLSGPSPSPLVQDVLKQASAAGVLAFAAPGNEPTTLPTYPAAYPETLAVTASGRSGTVAPYANRGTFVDLMAPGTSVVPFAGDTWSVQGTSVSTAYAAGIAAGLLSQPGRAGADVVSEMRQKLGFRPPASP